MSGGFQKEKEEHGSSLWGALAVTGLGVTAGAALAWFVHKCESEYEKQRKTHLVQCPMDFVTVEELISSGDLQLGDLIEFKRSKYQHWAIYVGDDKVIHLRNDGTVKVEELRKIAEGGLCRINLHEMKAAELGLQRRRTRIEIAGYAWGQVGKPQNYDVEHNNCEHFATKCFYDQAFSCQQEILQRNGFVRLAARGSAATYPFE